LRDETDLTGAFDDLARLRLQRHVHVFLERLLPARVDLAAARDDDAQPDRSDDPLAAGEPEHARRGLLLAVDAATAADRRAGCEHGEHRENPALERRRGALAQ